MDEKFLAAAETRAGHVQIILRLKEGREEREKREVGENKKCWRAAKGPVGSS